MNSEDEATNFNNYIAYNNINFKPFDYNTKRSENTETQPPPKKNNGFQLKDLSNFWRSLEMPLINSKVEMDKVLCLSCSWC